MKDYEMLLIDRIAAEERILQGAAGKLTAEEMANHKGKLWAFEKARELFKEN